MLACECHTFDLGVVVDRYSQTFRTLDCSASQLRGINTLFAKEVHARMVRESWLLLRQV
jgi:hypothetical protein